MFIVFEGVDSTGKSTQVHRLANRLREAGKDVVQVSDPGYTSLGKSVHSIINFPEFELEHITELFLFAAARAQLVRRVIKPALAEGRIVISDRYTSSTIAYQGGGFGIAREVIDQVNAIATEGVMPSRQVLLDSPPHEEFLENGDKVPTEGQLTMTAIGEAALDSRARIRSHYEKLEGDFKERVRGVYLELARGAPEEWVVIDGSGGVEEVGEAVWKALFGG